MTERPILFRAPMVRALLNGTKTQTRRVIKLPHASPLEQWEATVIGGQDGGRTATGATIPEQGAIWHTRTGECLTSPYGQPGDRLWVRETLACTAHHGTWYDADEDGFNNMIDDERADALASRYGDPYFATEVRRIPSIHMPRWASRILLEITGVRVERLQDISREDAIAEGVEPHEVRQFALYGTTAEERAVIHRDAAVGPYHGLWDSINGAGSWDTNPWVWVVEFRRIEP